VVVAGLLEGVEGGVEVVGVEQAGEPLVEVGQQVGLAQVDRAGVVQAGGGLILGWVGAAVVGLVVDPVALQPAGADAAA
jgi:hypothetical protein